VHQSRAATAGARGRENVTGSPSDDHVVAEAHRVVIVVRVDAHRRRLERDVQHASQGIPATSTVTHDW
jgi:hypothetical protein